MGMLRKKFVAAAIAVFLAAAPAGIALAQNDAAAENTAAEAESATDEQPGTGKFDHPFEQPEGMEAEDIGVKIGDQGDTHGFDHNSAVAALCIGGIAAVAATAVALYLSKKRKKEEAQKAALRERRLLNAAEAFIAKNPVLYADMADMLRTRKCRMIYAREDGVFFRDDDGFYENGTYVFAAKNETAARKILLLFPEEYENVKNSAFVCHGKKQAEFCRSFFGFDRVTECYQVTYTPPAPLPLKGALRFEKAGEKQLQTIIDTYALESPDTLRKLVAAKKINCAYATDASERADGEENQAGASGGIKEHFVGYIGQHPEGSMGLLLIFPEYRRHGYAEELESYQINEIRAEGRTPYAHIITDNFKSISLQKKLGANVADDLVIWMSRSDREKK